MSEEEKKMLGRHLRRARQKFGMTLRELSKESGIDSAYLSRIENGQEKVSDRALDEYSERFRVDRDEANRLAGRVSGDVERFLVKHPDALKRIREEMKEEAR